MDRRVKCVGDDGTGAPPPSAIAAQKGYDGFSYRLVYLNSDLHRSAGALKLKGCRN
jgi:hypothetical protein